MPLTQFTCQKATEAKLGKVKDTRGRDWDWDPDPTRFSRHY